MMHWQVASKEVWHWGRSKFFIKNKYFYQIHLYVPSVIVLNNTDINLIVNSKAFINLVISIQLNMSAGHI
jgi:hypothetical protein